MKLKGKYTKYHGKYQDLRIRICEGCDVRALREELKKWDEKLMQAIEKCIILEGMLRSKEEDLKLSRGVGAQCSDL